MKKVNFNLDWGNNIISGQHTFFLPEHYDIKDFNYNKTTAVAIFKLTKGSDKFIPVDWPKDLEIVFNSVESLILNVPKKTEKIPGVIYVTGFGYIDLKEPDFIFDDGVEPDDKSPFHIVFEFSDSSSVMILAEEVLINIISK